MNTRNSRAFALPTVLIVSIIMLTVLISAVSSTSAVRVALKSQYYNQLSEEAADAGVVYAKACIAKNGPIPQWSDAKPLMPNTDCSGNQLAGLVCTSLEPRCSVLIVDGNVTSSFSVAYPKKDSNGVYSNISSVGNSNLLRSSDNSVWRRYTAYSP